MMSEVPLYSLFMEVAGYVCRGVDSASLFLRSCQEAQQGAAMGRGVWGGGVCRSMNTFIGSDRAVHS